MEIQAAARLRAGNQEELLKLEPIYKALKRQGFDVELGTEDINGEMDASDVEELADELNKLGYKLQIKPGVFQKETFALVGKGKLTLQYLKGTLRIFYPD